MDTSGDLKDINVSGVPSWMDHRWDNIKKRTSDSGGEGRDKS